MTKIYVVVTKETPEAVAAVTRYPKEVAETRAMWEEGETEVLEFQSLDSLRTYLEEAIDPAVGVNVNELLEKVEFVPACSCPTPEDGVTADLPDDDCPLHGTSDR